MALLPRDDTEEVYAYDLPGGEVLAFSVRKSAGTLQILELCANPEVPKGDREWVTIDSFRLNPRGAALRRVRLDEGAPFAGVARLLDDAGAQKTGQNRDGDHVWHHYLLRDGREIKFSVRAGYPGTWNISVRPAGSPDWQSQRRVWLTPDGGKP